MTLSCIGFLAIAGIVTAGIAMGKVQTNPESARTLTIWSWVIFAVNVLIVAAFIIILLVAAANAPTTTTPTTGT